MEYFLTCMTIGTIIVFGLIYFFLLTILKPQKKDDE